jgi:hypothetical protein
MLQLEQGDVDLFSKTIKDDGLEIDMQVAEKPGTIDEYVQTWRNQIREHGFFKGMDSYSKTNAFKDYRLTDLAVKRVVFRYEFHFLIGF